MTPSFNDINFIDIDKEHMLGRIHSVISGSVVDGPGIRCVIFLQGCQFQCLYCHNRDTWDRDAGKLYTVAELVDEALSYVGFMDASDGGVTVSGGEALLQAEFVALLFAKLNQMGVHTCLDTNGYASRHIYGKVLNTLLANTNLVMLDIKQMNPEKHEILTGIGNEVPLAFARHLAEVGQPTRVRYVVVPGYTDDTADLRKLGEFLSTLPNLERLELLPYHKMGTQKWKELGYQYPLEHVFPPSAEHMQTIQKLFHNEYGLDVLL